FGGTVTTQAFLGEVSACAALKWLRLCGLGAAGAMRVSSAGYSLGPTEQAAALALVGVRVAAELRPLRLFVVGPSLDLGATLARARVVSEALVWAAPPVLGSLGLTVLWSEAEESQ